jgi:hypothetical protein
MSAHKTKTAVGFPAATARPRACAGELVQAWGAEYFYMPHMVTVDNAGFVWTTDVGLHTACKFSPAGERVLCLGVPLEPGHDAEHLCKPTQARAPPGRARPRACLRACLRACAAPADPAHTRTCVCAYAADPNVQANDGAQACRAAGAQVAMAPTAFGLVYT